MGRRRQVSDREISVAAREVFLDRGPKAPVAMVAKKLGVSTATLFQRTGSKQQLMLMAFQPEGAPSRSSTAACSPAFPSASSSATCSSRSTSISAPSSRPRSRCARRASSRTCPSPRRRSCARGSPHWLTQAATLGLLTVVDAARYGRHPDRRDRVAAHPLVHAAAAPHLAAASRVHPRDARRGVPGPLAFPFDDPIGTRADARRTCHFHCQHGAHAMTERRDETIEELFDRGLEVRRAVLGRRVRRQLVEVARTTS